MHFKILKIHFINAMKYPAKNPAKFLKPEPEPEPDIEAGYPLSGRIQIQPDIRSVPTSVIHQKAYSPYIFQRTSIGTK